MKKDLDDLGGFDERFAPGFAFEDSELIWRIKEVKKMEVKIIDRPFVIHQYHEPSNYREKQEFFIRNAQLYEQIKKEKNYRVNQ
jgi:GT2 family glycosyltransferase